MTVRIITADVFEGLAQLPDESVHCVVTSVPYYGLRDYGTGKWEGGNPACDHKGAPHQSKKSTLAGNGHGSGKRLSPQLQAMAQPFREACGRCGAIRIDKQIGLEPTLGDYLDKMVEVFREMRRVLRRDGTCWLNIGDSYAGSWGAQGRQGSTGEMASRSIIAARQIARAQKPRSGTGSLNRAPGLKPKDLMMVPARLAIALQDDGWWLRQDIIWHKPNPMPESSQDRCTKAHEYVFLLTKSERYWYDADAIRDGRASDEDAAGFRGGSYVRGKPGKRQATGNRRIKIPGGWDLGAGGHGTIHRAGRTSAEYQDAEVKDGRNKRSVWTIATTPFPEAHFATMPPSLAEPCILAGCPAGGTVLDPFGGAGTTGLVADRLGRDVVLIELNPEYAAMAERRIARDRLERGAGTMEEVRAARLPETPLEAWIKAGDAA